MEPIVRAGAERRRPLPSAETTPDGYWFDGYSFELSDPTMDAVDRIVGRAAVDPAFRARLVASPSAALATEPMPLGLKRELVSVRARDLADFARRALEAAARLANPTHATDDPARSVSEEYAPSLAGAASLAGAGS